MNKNIVNIALIFMIIGVVLETEIVYALRPNLITSTTSKEFGNGLEQREIERIMQQIETRYVALNKLREGGKVIYGDRYAIEQYLLVLELLHTIGVIKGNLLYLCIGNDYFPSYFAEKTFGLNSITGLGFGMDLSQLEEEAIKIGLPESYRKKEKRLEIIQANIFNCNAYFSNVLRQGGVDVLLVKGLTHWVTHYASYPGAGGSKVDGDSKQAQLHIQQLISKINDELMKDSSFVIIAHEEDMWLYDFLQEYLGYIDILKETRYGRIQSFLDKNYHSYEIPFDAIKGVFILLGIPAIKILKKPSRAILMQRKRFFEPRGRQWL